MKSFSEVYPTLKRVSQYRVEAIECSDGFKVSIQASECHYCKPRDNTGPYHMFELGYPSQQDDLILRYAEEPSSPTETVYAYVPVEIIDAMLAKHGGIKEKTNAPQ